MALDLNQLSDDGLNLISKYKTLDKAMPYMSDDDLKKIVEMGKPEPQGMSTGQAARIGLEKGVTFGLRPVVAGAGEAASQVIGDIGIGKGIGESLSKVPESYTRGRKEALSEQEQAMREHPYTAFASEMVGGLPTGAALGIGKGAVTLAQKTASGMKLGAGLGAAQALSEGQDLKEAAKTTLIGGALGGATAVGGQKIGEKLPAVKEKIGSLLDFAGQKAKQSFVKTANALTGVSEQTVKTYVDEHAAVQKMIKESGGNVSVAADTLRENLKNKIDNFRMNINKQISGALENALPEKTVSIDPIFQSLNKTKERLSETLNREEISAIDDMISRITQTADADGLVSPEELYQIQGWLYDRAKGAYQKGGQMFIPGKVEQLAAKNAARETKIILNEELPELIPLNNQLSKLHKIEENINKNLIAPGKPESALLAAGSATTGRNRQYLESLGATIGKDVVPEAQKLSAVAAFANPQLMPMSGAGTTSTSRTLTGALAGSISAGPVGAAIGAALTSPAALKTAIDSGVFSKKVLSELLGPGIDFASEKALKPVVEYLKTPEGLNILNRAVQSGVQTNAVQRRINELNQGAK